MLKLGVNIDHVATLREARYRGRGRGEPDPVAARLPPEWHDRVFSQNAAEFFRWPGAERRGAPPDSGQSELTN